jgi:hypothetical protein
MCGTSKRLYLFTNLHGVTTQKTWTVSNTLNLAGTKSAFDKTTLLEVLEFGCLHNAVEFVLSCSMTRHNADILRRHVPKHNLRVKAGGGNQFTFQSALGTVCTVCTTCLKVMQFARTMCLCFSCQNEKNVSLVLMKDMECVSCEWKIHRWSYRMWRYTKIQYKNIMRDRRLPPLLKSILPFSALLCGVRCFETDASGLPVSVIFQGQDVILLGHLYPWRWDR